MRVCRDRAWVEREYGADKWPPMLEAARALIAAGETSLSRAVHTLARAEWEGPGREPLEITALERRVVLPAAFAWFGAYAWVAETVRAAVRPETEAVYDLGAGWGRSLFQVWLGGGPRSVVYGALEFTEAGRRCADTLAALEPAMRFISGPFDFTCPAFPRSPRPSAHAVLFSVSSAHQIPIFTKDMVRGLFRAARVVDCLFFEQIGFQIAPGAEGSPEAGEYAARNDYNLNLLSVLRDLADDGELELVAVERDVAGVSAEYPLSLAWWRHNAA